jgi:hypothetical protein
VDDSRVYIFLLFISNHARVTFSSAFDDHPQLHVLEVNSFGWQDHLTLKTKLTHNVTSMCLVNDVIWFGDNLGFVHAYSVTSFEKLFTYKMEPDCVEDIAENVKIAT